MNKIWAKDNLIIDNKIENFTIDDDHKIDIRLAFFDVIGSIAHAKMLYKVNILKKMEYDLIMKGLKLILYKIKNQKFFIRKGIEDIHSQVEFDLTTIIGESAKKIHTGRSRNDQVITDIKMYLREEIYKISYKIFNLSLVLLKLSNIYKNHLIPGYTHMQVAMPSSFGLLFGSYAESLCDDMEMMLSSYNIINKNPLGSAAGFGSSFKIDREFTTELLGFKTLNINSLYAQGTRGKTEKVFSMGISSIASTISKISYDMCLYMSENYGFIQFPDHLTTGSSIMPHKKNPDVFELIRAKCNIIQSIPYQITLLCNNMPSGYHRDFQNTKKIIFNAIDDINSCIDMTIYMLNHVIIKDKILDDTKYKYIFSVNVVHKYLLDGMTFRDAYKKVGNLIANKEYLISNSNEKLDYTHIGSIGNLCNEYILSNFNSIIKKFKFHYYINRLNLLLK